jgi:hypothetical protein
VELLAGVMIDYAPIGASQDLDGATDALLQRLKQGDPNIKIEKTESATVGDRPAKMTVLASRSSYSGDPEQAVQLYSVVRSPGLWTLVFAVPKSRAAEAEPIFRQMLQSVAFPQ